MRTSLELVNDQFRLVLPQEIVSQLGLQEGTFYTTVVDQGKIRVDFFDNEAQAKEAEAGLPDKS